MTKHTAPTAQLIRLRCIVGATET